MTPPRVLFSIAGLIGLTLAETHPVLVALAVAFLVGIAAWATLRQRSADRRAAAETARAAAAEDELDSVWRLGLPLVKVDSSPPLRDAHYLRASDAFATLIGYPSDVLLARPFIEFVHESAREATVAMANRIDRIGSGAADQFVNAYTAGPLHARPGTLVWLQWMPAGAGIDSTIYHVTDVTAVREKAVHAEKRADDAEADLEAIRPTVDAILRAVPAAAGPAPALLTPPTGIPDA